MRLETVRQTYTTWAPLYDATHTWAPRRREARLALGLRPGERVLDLACGTGLNLAHLRELVGDAGQVTGADLTPAMLEVARGRIARAGWRNVEAIEADAASLPFPDGSFDRAICTYALNVIPAYERAIAEVERVLVPGGRFVDLEMRSMQHGPPGWLQWLPHICAVDVTHQTLDELRRVFARVEVRHHWLGLVFVAVATKRG